jgi:gamma-glutamyltranspeptidase/glutathione hydrolase
VRPAAPSERRSRPRLGAFLLAALACLWLFAMRLPAEPRPPHAAIASAHPLATEAGFAVLQAGGNAFDAAVAVTAALAVVEPYSSGIGGGGFWLLHRASDRCEVMIDGRERAPLEAQAELYLDSDGEVIPGLSMNGPLAAGIPGEPAALVHIAEAYGRLPLERVLQPAIDLAREGFEVDAHYQRMARFRLPVLKGYPTAADIFLEHDEVPALAYRIQQPDLADTLASLAEHGREGFYGGPVARRLVEGVRKAGGIWSLEDLVSYRIVERDPVRGAYRGIAITSASPPSSGGIALLTMLNLLAGYPLAEFDPATRIHLMVEAMRRAYRDRAAYLGDPDFIDIPAVRLLHPRYADGLRAAIRQDRATPSELLPGASDMPGGPHTTHFSILDTEGNRVAATLSINYPFGSGFVVPGTGVLLNDEMDDFSAKPGVPNAYGLIGATANAIAPGKRPLSSMTPTFLDDGTRVAILGTPGGSRIITMVLAGTLDFAAGDGPQSWVSKPRVHHQYLPDEIQFEEGALPGDVMKALQQRGHTLRALERPYGNMQAILWNRDTGEVTAASDPRGAGGAGVR